MLWIWAALPLVLAGSQLSVLTQETKSISEGLELRRNVHETETNCSGGLYPGGRFCCQPCQPGERKQFNCAANGGKPVCLPCTEGKEYMDKEHYSDKCRRCTLCDGEHGLEVETNCTQTQNTKCRCKPGFYCNASVCDHCDPCISCEHGILEQCTTTSNTKCKKESSRNHLPLWLSLTLVPLVGLAIYIYILYRRRCRNHPASGIPDPENVPINFSDVDVSKYISSIAEQMTIHQVKKFVRENGISEAKMDDIKNDNMNDTAEQKIQLLRYWYQSHGKKDAYHTLIKGLKKANCCALAERIQTKVQEDIENSTSNIRNENDE